MYTEYQPSPLLAAYVDKYWEFKGNPEAGMCIHILPDGCTDFIFTMGEVAEAIQGKLILQPYRSFFVGPMNKYSKLITYADTVHMLGIRFLPGGIFRFMNLPLTELVNQRIDTRNLATLFDDVFTEKLCEQTSLEARICLMEELLIKALVGPDLTHRQITFAIQQINFHQGQLPVHSLIEKICLGQRHFERKFKQHTGYTPKEYSRIMKFRHAVELLKQTKSDSLLSVAVNTGYYDSAHLAKEIKILSGKTTSSFLPLQLSEDTPLTYI